MEGVEECPGPARTEGRELVASRPLAIRYGSRRIAPEIALARIGDHLRARRAAAIAGPPEVPGDVGRADVGVVRADVHPRRQATLALRVLGKQDPARRDGDGAHGVSAEAADGAGHRRAVAE